MDYSKSGFTLRHQYGLSLLACGLSLYLLGSLLCEQMEYETYYSRPCSAHYKWNNLVTFFAGVISGSHALSHAPIYQLKTFPSRIQFRTHVHRKIEWTKANALLPADNEKAARTQRTKIICIFLGHLAGNRKTKLLISEPLSNCHAWTRGDQRARRQFNFL